MKLVERILLALYSLFVAALALLFIAMPFSENVYQWTSSQLAFYRLTWQNIFIPVLFLSASLRFLASGLWVSRRKRNAIVRHTAYGEVKISFETIEGMALKIARSAAGLRDIKASVDQIAEGVIISLHASTIGDMNIPESSVKLQQNIKDYIEEYTGVHVKEVKVYIENVSTISKGRVE
ncbi:MAG: alkaline shock response membrane anchor protein AmaP [Bacillota bacterium]